MMKGSGSGSRRPKNMWIRWIRIRNTALNNFFYILLLFAEGSSGHKVSYAYFVAFFEQLFYLLLLFAEGSSCHKVSYAYFVAYFEQLIYLLLLFVEGRSCHKVS
jgi:hypothetical protein